MLGTEEEVFEGGCEVNRYQKEFISIDGNVFYADVYSVLVAFGVKCPAIQHAVKKLLMPGQRGLKSEVSDLYEANKSVVRAVDMAYARLRDSDGTSDEAEPEPMAEPEPKPKMVTWRRCVRIDSREIDDNRPRAAVIAWHPSGNIPEHWYPIEAYEQPIETVKQLPEGQEP